MRAPTRPTTTLARFAAARQAVVVAERCRVRWLVSTTALLLLGAVGSARAQQVFPPVPPEPTLPEPTWSQAYAPESEYGSFTPDVYREDLGHTLRVTELLAVTVDHSAPDVAYVSSQGGYVFKTTDGGKTWDESRLIVERRPTYGDAGQVIFYGAQRFDGWGSGATRVLGPRLSMVVPSVTRGQLEIGGGSLPDIVYGNSTVRPTMLGRPRDFAFRRASGTSATNEPLSTTSGQHRAMKSRWNVLGYAPIAPGSGDRVSEEANRNFGVGLPGRAPRLQAVVRRFGKPTAGLNIKQTLLLRGNIIPHGRLFVIHPSDPKWVYLCTLFGLFMTEDGGQNWVRTWPGFGNMSRMVFSAAVDPLNPDRVLIATGDGLFFSEDRGHSWSKSTQQGLGSGVVWWIYFNPWDPRYIFAGTDYGMLRSPDSGRTWEWIYFTTFPTARVVRYVTIDPHDRQRGYIATHDGLFTTANLMTAQLEDWQQLGGPKFLGQEMLKVSANPWRKGHLWALSNLTLPSLLSAGTVDSGGAYIWESIDGGQQWKVIYSGESFGRLAWFDNDPRDPALLWVVWSRALWRMRRNLGDRPRDEHELPPARRVALAKLLHGDSSPVITDMLWAAYRYTGFEVRRQLDYRARARFKGLLPRVELSWTHLQARDYGRTQDGILTGAGFPYRFDNQPAFRFNELRLMLSWDLSSLVFNLESSLFGRIERLNSEGRDWLRRSIHRLYSEYRRTQALLLTTPPDDMRLRLTYRLWLEELHAYLDFITGGYLTRYARGDRPRGYDAKWFVRWPGTGPDLRLPPEEKHHE
ncbi:MAG: hypothetical protein IPG96_10295 [Proteobacteria bacterium]|nr:hypothetical protein [Pseudomonadota bacterium]